MQNPFAGHSHGPSPYFVPDCALCDAAKEARNRAIGHLNDALRLLTGYHPDGHDRPTLRLNLSPTSVTAEDVTRCHSIDLTPKQAEALADVLDSLNTANDHHMANRMMAAADARIASWEDEQIPGGDWSAAAVAQNDTDVWDAVNDVFAGLNRVDIGNEVLRDKQADLARVSEALDEVLPYPYAEEDVPLPHDQAQMDALTSEAEDFLQDGGE